MGWGFKMPELYKTGYTVLGVSTILALIMASLQTVERVTILFYEKIEKCGYKIKLDGEYKMYIINTAGDLFLRHAKPILLFLLLIF